MRMAFQSACANRQSRQANRSVSGSAVRDFDTGRPEAFVDGLPLPDRQLHRLVRSGRRLDACLAETVPNDIHYLAGRTLTGIHYPNAVAFQQGESGHCRRDSSNHFTSSSTAHTADRHWTQFGALETWGEQRRGPHPRVSAADRWGRNEHRTDYVWSPSLASDGRGRRAVGRQPALPHSGMRSPGT
jgi:hypothetical protein